MYLTLSQAAVSLGKSERQVRYMIEKGQLAARKVDGRWRIDSDGLPLSSGQQAARARKEEQIHRAVEDTFEADAAEVAAAAGLPARRYSVLDMKALQIALPLYRRSSDELGAEHAATLYLRDALALLTQGCHRFEKREKAEAYRQARDATSLAVCELVLANGDIADAIRGDIEQELMACFAGLLRITDVRRRRA